MATTSPALLEGFRARAEAAQSIVHELAGWAEVAALALELAGDEPVAVTPSLAAARPELVSALGSRAVLPDGAAPFPSVADAAVGVAEGVLAIAESGSVLLSHGELADRAVSMFARTGLQVVLRERVVASLDDAAEWLETSELRGALATLVTGPSRTADIERSLTIGVQGPSDLHVVVLG
jgi:L-lactate dehydrogenase complex protein LldG